jgi:hypothetical protein
LVEVGCWVFGWKRERSSDGECVPWATIISSTSSTTTSIVLVEKNAGQSVCAWALDGGRIVASAYIGESHSSFDHVELSTEGILKA